MNLLLSVALLSTLVSSVVITYPNGGGFHFPHLTATFGPPPSTYSVSAILMADYTLLCNDPAAPSLQYLNTIVLIERGVCTFTDKALRAQQLGAVGVIIGGNDESDILGYLGSAPGSESVNIPTVYVSGQSYQKLLMIVQNYGLSGDSVTATLNSVGEGEGTIGFLLPITPPVGGSGDGYPGVTGPLVDPNMPTEPTDPVTPYPTGGYVQPPVDDALPDYDDANSTLGIVWIIVGLSVLVKCMIICVACRRRYRSKPSRAASSSAGSDALLTEGEVNDATPVVYATYPAPSSAFTISAEASAEEEGALPPAPVAAATAVARSVTASSLSMYPSIQYTRLMPQATAPSDVYAYDLERQVVIIRG